MIKNRQILLSFHRRPVKLSLQSIVERLVYRQRILFTGRGASIPAVNLSRYQTDVINDVPCVLLSTC